MTAKLIRGGRVVVIVALVVAGLLFLAHPFRYDVVRGEGLGVLVWDRWLHRACISVATADGRWECE